MQSKWLKRIATVKDDGTVQFDVPGDIKPPSLDFGTGVVYDATADEEHAETPELEDKHLRPLQIVMLIVGTRGDVQPFIAIGKRLQVIRAYPWNIILFCVYIRRTIGLQQNYEKLDVFLDDQNLNFFIILNGFKV